MNTNNRKIAVRLTIIVNICIFLIAGFSAYMSLKTSERILIEIRAESVPKIQELQNRLENLKSETNITEAGSESVRKIEKSITAQNRLLKSAEIRVRETKRKTPIILVSIFAISIILSFVILLSLKMGEIAMTVTYQGHQISIQSCASHAMLKIDNELQDVSFNRAGHRMTAVLLSENDENADTELKVSISYPIKPKVFFFLNHQLVKADQNGELIKASPEELGLEDSQS
ncbi:MAG: hypothetical protein CVV64_10215 [Candidatus Wallbacteria bacterium HGW-Wallbacteria-1]|uniref:Uncharacterized protein n=1 Tax=Candidatus Wallbacteria bacterium HGW-Wallbacteria-1 TaxID=2013854 RepID=A0A2N1PPS1_9BACT|nr:MAG: hypothetical protein CVV64_10215 [Candidatus Wallbacteria bacterium HGW-Wallbacteria-1]